MKIAETHPMVTPLVLKRVSVNSGFEPYGFVYFMHSPDACLVKIGHTKTSLPMRIKNLIMGSPVPLNPIAYVVGSSDVERALHRRFAHLRRHGEWFRAKSELLAFIAESAIAWPSPGDIPAVFAVGDIDRRRIEENAREWMHGWFYEDRQKAGEYWSAVHGGLPAGTKKSQPSLAADSPLATP